MKLKTLKISQFDWIYFSSLEIIAIKFIALKKKGKLFVQNIYYSYQTFIASLITAKYHFLLFF
jgi:hypothetical protein